MFGTIHPQLDMCIGQLRPKPVGFYALLHGQIFKHSTGHIITYEPQQFDLGPQCLQICRHMACATQSVIGFLVVNHRHWRFWRNPAGMAKPIAIQHNIADDHNRQVIKLIMH